jgi:hypothetical protein
MHDAVKTVWARENSARKEARLLRRNLKKERKEASRRERLAESQRLERVSQLITEIKIEALAAVERLSMLVPSYQGGLAVGKRWYAWWWKGVLWRIEGSESYHLLHTGRIYEYKSIGRTRRYTRRYRYELLTLLSLAEPQLQTLKQQLKTLGVPDTQPLPKKRGR